MDTPIGPAWLTVAQVAAATQLSRQTIRRYLRAGTLPGRWLGGRGGWRVLAIDVDRFMRSADLAAVGGDRGANG